MTTPEALQEEAAATAAEIEAAEAEVAEAEAAIEEGADVEFDRVPKIEHRLRLLRTRLRGLGRRREVAATDRRLGELEKLRAVLEEEAVEHAQQVAQAAGAAYEAIVPLFDAVRRCNDWREARLAELHAHQVPAWGGAVTPSPAHAGLGVNGAQIAMGRLRVEALDPVPVAAEIARIVRDLGDYGAAPAEEVPFLAGLAGRVLHEASEHSEDTRFFRHRENGNWFTMSTEYAERTPHALTNLDEKTREEWVAEQWRSAG